MQKRLLSFILLAVTALVFFIDTTANNINQQRSQTLASTEHRESVELILQTLQEKLHSNISQTRAFAYLIQLLQYGNETDQPFLYFKTVFKTFSTIVKQYEYINAYTFAQMTAQLPACMEPFVTKREQQNYLRSTSFMPDTDTFDRFTGAVYSMLNTEFRKRYEEFTQDPELFLHQLTHNVGIIAQAEADIVQLRALVMRFLELCLTKIIWSPTDKQKTWETTKEISQHLAQLVEHKGLTDVNDLDDLYWSLICRYSYFLDITAPMTETALYKEIHNDMQSQQLLLFDIEQQDTSRKEYMIRSLTHAEARCRAYQQGLITQ